MRTIVGHNKAVWQKAEGGGRVRSVIQSGRFFRFVIEAMVIQPAENGLEAYTYPEELHLSGLYGDQQAAQAAALCFTLEGCF